MSRLQKLAIVLLRVAVGWYFLYAGIAAINNSAWSILPYLENATLFSHFYSSIAHPNLLPLLSYACKGAYIIIGLLLISGVFARFAAFMGMLIALFFYIAMLDVPMAAGIMGTNYLVNEYAILICALFLLFALRAGEYFGLATHFKMSRY